MTPVVSSRRSLLLTLPVVFALAFHSTARAQTSELRLQLLYGKTGRAVANTPVSFWRDMNKTPLAPGAPAQVTTDGEGYATIPPNDSEFLVLFAEGRQTCSLRFNHTFSLTDVRMRGLVSENSCNKHIHMYAGQGSLVVFVRELGWLERMRRPAK